MSKMSGFGAFAVRKGGDMYRSSYESALDDNKTNENN